MRLSTDLLWSHLMPWLRWSLWGSATLALLVLPALASGAPTAAARVDWPTFAFDLARSGYNPFETTLGPGNVGSLTLRWSFNTGGELVAQPVYAAGVTVGAQKLDLVIVGTEAGDVIAVNAATGTQVWRRNIGLSVHLCARRGITGTPALERATNRVYAVAGDGKVYALNLSTGAIVPGWPVATWTSTTLDEYVYSAVTLANGQVYVAVASQCGDRPPYYGGIFAISTVQAKKTATFLTVPPSLGGGGAIWGFGGASVDTATGNLYTATGNALNANEGAAYGEHVVVLSSTLQVLAANDPGIPSTGDYDFGSHPVLFQAPGCVPQFTVTNKIGNLYLYNRDQVAAGPVQTIMLEDDTVHSPDGLIGVSAYWPVGNLVYTPVTFGGGAPGLQPGLVAHRVGSDCRLSQVWNAALGGAANFSSATIANGVVYVGTGENNSAVALDATTGAALWSFTAQGPVYPPPIAINGHVFVAASDNTLYAFQPGAR